MVDIFDSNYYKRDRKIIHPTDKDIEIYYDRIDKAVLLGGISLALLFISYIISNL